MVPTTQTRSITTGQVQEDEDYEGVQDEREIWEVTHVSEQDLETTEGEGVDLLDKHLDLVGWSQVNDKETEKDLS